MSLRNVRKLEELFLEKFLEKYNLTERDVKRAFSKFDKDNNGSLDVKELSACIQQFLNGIPTGEIEELVKCYDVNGDGKLSYEEFTHLLSSKSATSENFPSQHSRNNNREVGSSYSSSFHRKCESDARADVNLAKPLIDRNIRKVECFHRGHSESSRNYPPQPPSEIESIIALDDEAEVHARAVSYLNNLKSLLSSQANQVKTRLRMSDRLSVQNSDLIYSIIQDLISKAFQPFLSEGSFDNANSGSGRRYGRSPSGVTISQFIKVLRHFTKAGASTINPIVARHVWTMCQPFNRTGSADTINPCALIDLLFAQASNNHIVKGGVRGLNPTLHEHPVSAVTEYLTAEQKEQQKLMMPPPPPGSFKKIISHPTRTLLTVPSNFDERTVLNSSRLPAYTCAMDHVIGLSQNLYSGNQIHSSVDSLSGKPVLVYSSAAVGVIHDPVTNKQSFLLGHTDDIVCVAVSADGRFVATGQIGKDPYINVWSLKHRSASTAVRSSDGAYGAENDQSSCLLHTIGGKAGMSPLFFSRGICSVEISPNGRYVLGVGCDDKHRMGIWDIGRNCALVADTVVQNGLPPQIKCVVWCPEQQVTSDYISRDHCGHCELIATLGVHHLKLWSFATAPSNFVNINAGVSSLVSRNARIDKQAHSVVLAGVMLSGAFIADGAGKQADFVCGGSNGIVYLFRQGALIAFNSLAQKRKSAHTGMALTAGNIAHPSAVYALRVAHGTVFCGGKSGLIHCLDGKTLSTFFSIACFDEVSVSRPVASFKDGNNVHGNAGSVNVSGLAILADRHSGSSDASLKVSQSSKRVRLVATSTVGIAKYFCVLLKGGNCTVDKPPLELFHYHTGALHGLAVDHVQCGQESPALRLLASAGDDKIVAIWNARTYKRLCFARTQAAAKCCFVDDSGRFVVVGLASGGVVVYLVTTEGGSGTRGRVSDETVSCSSFGSGRPSSSTRMRNPVDDRAKKHFDRLSATMKEIAYRKDSSMELSDIKFDASGVYIAAGSHDSNIYIYRLTSSPSYSLKLVNKLKGHRSYVTHLDWSNDSQMLRSTCGAYELLFWNVPNGGQNTSSCMNESWRTNTCVLGFDVMGIWAPGSDGTDINALDVCKDSDIVATADDFGTLKLFHYPCIVKHAKGRICRGHCSHVTNVRFYSDCTDTNMSQVATTGGNDAALILWKVKPVR